MSKEREYTRKTFFTDKQLMIIQSIVNGFLSTREIAENLNWPVSTTAMQRTNITAQMSGREGTDKMMKAVVFATLHELIDTSNLPDKINRKELSILEVQYLMLMGMGLNSKERARRAGISFEDSKKVESSVLEKLNVKNRYQAVALAINDAKRSKKKQLS